MIKTAVFEQHSGVYTCIARDSHQSVSSSEYLDVWCRFNCCMYARTVKLQVITVTRLCMQAISFVQFPLLQLEHQGNNVVEELDSIILHCSFSANPKPLISWLKRAPDGLIRIVSSSRISVSLDYDNNTKLGVSMLTIAESVEQDAGVYICEASNVVPTISVEAAEWNVTVVGMCNDDIVDWLVCLVRGKGWATSLVRMQFWQLFSSSFFVYALL